jgi:hypothetical protein
MAVPSPKLIGTIASWTGVIRRRLLSRAGRSRAGRAAATINTEELGYGVLSTSPPLNPARTGCLLLDSVKVPALRFKDVDVQVRNLSRAGHYAEHHP